MPVCMPTTANYIRSRSTWHNPVHERDEEKECESLKKCFYYLDQTSRSFAAVIQELHPELLVPVVVFYLVLRGLDTIEDDMTLPLEKKEPILREFKTILDNPDWNFKDSGPNEEDRQLLVEFNVVTTEFIKLKPAYRKIIKDIADKMGNGMADFQSNFKKHGVDLVQSVDDYNLYCHYVAGLVGEGLTRLFLEAKLANPVLLERDWLFDSMGLFLQKTNIIRDIREDEDDKRRFYPKEIWSKHVDRFEDLFDPAHRAAALNCTSEMVLNALEHVPDVLHYLAGLREQSIFNFCAIPQTMAIATLDAVFRNPAVLERNVKITRGAACQIMIDSTQNLQMVCEVFRKYMRSILKKNNPRDPNFLKISIACSKAEQFMEKIFPTPDPKAAGHKKTSQQKAEEDKAKADAQEAKWDTIYMMLAVFGMLILITVLMVCCVPDCCSIQANNMTGRLRLVPGRTLRQGCRVDQGRQHHARAAAAKGATLRPPGALALGAKAASSHPYFGPCLLGHSTHPPPRVSVLRRISHARPGSPCTIYRQSFHQYNSSLVMSRSSPPPPPPPPQQQQHIPSPTSIKHQCQIAARAALPWPWLCPNDADIATAPKALRRIVHGPGRPGASRSASGGRPGGR